MTDVSEMLCLVLGLVLSWMDPLIGSRTSLCQKGQFYHDDRCLKCSICPQNEIIKVPCSDFSDLVCGPFFDPAFGSKEALPTRRSDEFQATMEHEGREDWKTLAFVLIGLLSLLIIVATLIVLVAWRKLQQAYRGKPVEDCDADDPDSGYVVIHAIRNMPESSLTGHMADPPPLLGASPDNTHGFVPPKGRLRFLPRMYKPRRWLINYDADEVFESEDSAGSTRLPACKLTTISEKSEKSDNKSSDSFKDKSDHSSIESDNPDSNKL